MLDDETPTVPAEVTPDEGAAPVKKAAKKVCKFKVKGTKVSAKPKCKRGLQIGVTVKGTATDRTPATWTKTWKLKKCKV